MRKALVVFAVFGCSHAAPPLDEAARREDISGCTEAPLSTDCCDGLAFAAEKLIGQGQREAGLAAFEDAAARCPLHEGVRRRRHLARHASPAKGPASPVKLSLGADYRLGLGGDLKLASVALLIDGRFWPEGGRPLSAGEHYMETELFLSKDSDVYRFTAEQPFVITPELADAGTLLAAFKVIVSDDGAATPLPSRVHVATELRHMGPGQPGAPANPRPVGASGRPVLNISGREAVLDTSVLNIPPPPEARRVHGWALIKVCAKEDGSLDTVNVLHSSNPEVTGPMLDFVRRFRYQPYVRNGEAYPFCHPMRLDWH
jgi:hypothetical protein